MRVYEAGLTNAGAAGGEDMVEKLETEDSSYSYESEEEEENKKHQPTMERPGKASENPRQADAEEKTAKKPTAVQRVAKLRERLRKKKELQINLAAWLEEAELREEMAELASDIASKTQLLDKKRARSPGQGAHSNEHVARCIQEWQGAKGKEPRTEMPKRARSPQKVVQKSLHSLKFTERARSPEPKRARSRESERARNCKKPESMTEQEAEKWAAEIQKDCIRESRLPKFKLWPPRPWRDQGPSRRWTKLEKTKKTSMLEQGPTVCCVYCIQKDSTCWTYIKKLDRPGHGNCKKCKRPYRDPRT